MTVVHSIREDSGWGLEKEKKHKRKKKKEGEDGFPVSNLALLKRSAGLSDIGKISRTWKSREDFV